MDVDTTPAIVTQLKERIVLCVRCKAIITHQKQIYLVGDKGRVGPLCRMCAGKYTGQIVQKLKVDTTGRARRATKRLKYRPEEQSEGDEQ